jgi:hypothetical protein
MGDWPGTNSKSWCGEGAARGEGGDRSVVPSIPVDGVELDEEGRVKTVIVTNPGPAASSAPVDDAGLGGHTWARSKEAAKAIRGRNSK